MQDGSSIALAIVINFPNLLFDATGVVGANNVTMSAIQHQNFTGTITAPGIGLGGETITIAGDGNVTTLANIETYALEDDSSNARILTISEHHRSDRKSDGFKSDQRHNEHCRG